MNGNNAIRTMGPDDTDATRTVRIVLPAHVRERMRKLYGEPGSSGGEPGSNGLSHDPDALPESPFRTLTGWLVRHIGR